MPADVMAAVAAAEFCGVCPRPSDGRVCRTCGAKLGGVKPDTLSAWVKRKHVKDVRYDGKHPWYQAGEIITVAWELGRRERARLAFLQGGIPDYEAVA